MKKYLLLNVIMCVSVLSAIRVNAQTQFDNASFEAWEEIGFGPDIIEPVNWSSIKSTEDQGLNNAAPIVWNRCDTMAHTGNYSLYLHSVAVFGIVATGIITNGRVHADYNPSLGYTYTDPDHEAWHTSITGKPDSLVGWYMALPSPGDFATVKVVLHRGYLAVAENIDSSAYIASGNLKLSREPVTEWTRFSLPINYYIDNENPEFALLILTSGNGVNAIADSKVWFDDIEFIYNNNSGIAEEDAANLDLFAGEGQLNVYVKTQKQVSYTLQVYDISGRLQMRDSGLTGIKNTYTYQLPSGTYIVSVKYGTKVLTKKVVL